VQLSEARPRGNLDLVGYVALLLAALGWAGAWLTARLAAHDIPRLTTTVGRFAVASVCLLPVWLLLEPRKSLRIPKQLIGTLVGFIATGIIAYNLLFMSGIALAPASDGAVITPGLAGIFAMIIAWLVQGTRPEQEAVIGAVLVASGVFLVGFSTVRQAGVNSGRLGGDLFFLISAMVWGLYTVFGRKLSAHLSAVSSIFYGAVIGTLVLVPIALIRDGVPHFAAWPMTAWLNVIYLGSAATALSFVMYYIAVKRLGVGQAAPGLGLVPLFAVVGAVLLLGEPITALEIAGGALTIVGIAVPPLLISMRRPATL
jgi:drug/metabolite transporter (DMT)-like permease